MTIDIGRVPPTVRHLTPLALRWGVVDDSERVELLNSAADDELVEISESVGEALDDLEAWLAGADASSPNPSYEYIAFTCLLMAMYQADLELGRRRGS